MHYHEHKGIERKGNKIHPTTSISRGITIKFIYLLSILILIIDYCEILGKIKFT